MHVVVIFMQNALLSANKPQNKM